MSNHCYEKKPGDIIINPGYPGMHIYDHVKHCDAYLEEKRKERKELEEKGKGEEKDEI